MLLEEQPICHLCGKCCHYIKDGKILKCRNLILLNGKTICRIYTNRLGFKIDEGVKCSTRISLKQNFKGCPYNIDGQPMSIIGGDKNGEERI
jgi:hypothetical protein